jgi:acyl carrier protein
MNRDEIREWLIEYVADQLGISPEDVEMDRTLASYGFDTEEIESMVAAIEDYFEESLPGDSVRTRSTVASLTRLLCEWSGADDDDDEAPEEPSRDLDMEEIARDIGLQ